MLKKLLFSIMFAAVAVTASAQYLSGIGVEPDRGNSMVMKYVVKAGANFTTVSSSANEMGFSMAPGFQIGVGYNIRWGYRTDFSRPGTGLVGFQPELLFSSQSVSLSNGEKFSMNRLALPLMVKAYPISEVYVELGPEFSYLFSTSPDHVSAGAYVYNIGECSGAAADLALGAGWESPMGFVAGVRYGLGLTALAKNLPWKTHNISLTMGWKF